MWAHASGPRKARLAQREDKTAGGESGRHRGAVPRFPAGGGSVEGSGPVPHDFAREGGPGRRGRGSRLPTMARRQEEKKPAAKPITRATRRPKEAPGPTSSDDMRRKRPPDDVCSATGTTGHIRDPAAAWTATMLIVRHETRRIQGQADCRFGDDEGPHLRRWSRWPVVRNCPIDSGNPVSEHGLIGEPVP